MDKGRRCTSHGLPRPPGWASPRVTTVLASTRGICVARATPYPRDHEVHHAALDVPILPPPSLAPLIVRLPRQRSEAGEDRRESATELVVGRDDAGHGGVRGHVGEVGTGQLGEGGGAGARQRPEVFG